MPTYDVSAHALRSPAAKALYTADASAFSAVASEAEKILGLDGTSYSGSDADSAKYAIVRQVNHMIEADETYVLYQAEKRGSRSREAREGAVQTIDPIARSIVEGLGIELGAAATFEVLRSLR